jgi:hypothetical protein
MKTNKRHLVAGVGTLLTAAVLSGVAVAGNPHGTPPGQAKAQANGSASASPSTAAGVKPSSTTNVQHNTNAAAGSTKTKLYGNGTTAGQIAMQNGASSSTNLYGPGNSQPHKPVCPGGKPTFDVHALKAHGGASCPAGPTSSPSSNGSTGPSTSTSGGTSGSVSTNGSGVSAGAHAQAGTGTKGAFTPPSASSRNGGVLGASVSTRARPARPVLGAANFTG